MTPSEADARWAKEKADLMAGLLPLSDEEKRALVKEASQYRSGYDSCNSVYMGSMATSIMCHALGGTWRDGLDILLEKANTRRLDAALEACASVILYMQAHPTVRCPCCGQITTPDKITG